MDPIVLWRHLGCATAIAAYSGPTKPTESPILASHMWRLRHRDGSWQQPPQGSIPRPVFCPDCGTYAKFLPQYIRRFRVLPP